MNKNLGTKLKDGQLFVYQRRNKKKVVYSLVCVGPKVSKLGGSRTKSRHAGR